MERLQAATAPAGQRDQRGIDAAEERAACALVLGQRPVDRVRQIGRLRARRLNLRRLSRLWRGTRLARRSARAAQDASAGDHEIAVRGDLEQMQPGARAVVGTPAVAPRDDAQLRRTERAEIFRAIDDVRRQRRDFLFHRGKASGARRVGLIGVGARRLRGCDSGSERRIPQRANKAGRGGYDDSSCAEVSHRSRSYENQSLVYAGWRRGADARGRPSDIGRAADVPPPGESACAALATAQFATVTTLTTTYEAGSAAQPAHCVVRGAAARRTGADGKPYETRFELRLPTAWSGRFLYQGGGGNDGASRRPSAATRDRFPTPACSAASPSSRPTRAIRA